ncbi:hypothetical protein HYDPIDRAFT_34745 [Hydnomerulius pinastri MD-312]|uniref:Uncharacterized protein n=1 Tax=Hydnomerulius pinastri MD-312 TaxID=994086 RepID=A0A0C9W6L8_9AGAM|nr:hypothetical protein HYDPIDRAFT_34745 [Hydnomerulius pinastri MD-312]
MSHEGDGHREKSKALITLADEDEGSDDHGYISSAKAKAKVASPLQSAKPLPVELNLSGDPRKKDIETAERGIMGRGAKGNENAGDSALTDEETSVNGDLPAKLAPPRKSLSPSKTKSRIPSHTQVTATQKISMSRFCGPRHVRNLLLWNRVRPSSRRSFDEDATSAKVQNGPSSGNPKENYPSELPPNKPSQKITQNLHACPSLHPEAAIAIEKALPPDILDWIKQSAVRHMGMSGGDDSELDLLDCLPRTSVSRPSSFVRAIL